MNEELYYYETPNSHGEFKAPSDQIALSKTPNNTLILYKESNTDDGLPFIIIFVQEQKGN